VPEGLEKAAFDQWHRENLRGHKAETKLVGSWNFAHTVNL
jgi:hypothetical protein